MKQIVALLQQVRSLPRMRKALIWVTLALYVIALFMVYAVIAWVVVLAFRMVL
jgi:hypothetical protein